MCWVGFGAWMSKMVKVWGAVEEREDSIVAIDTE